MLVPQIKADMIDATKAVGGFDGMIQRAEDMSRPLDLLGQHLVRKTRAVLRSGERGIRTLHESEGLAASMTYALDLDRQGVAMGSNKPYAGSQNFGPRGGFYESSRPGGFLAIPIADNLGARDPRYARPRDVPDGEIIRVGKGADEQLLLVSKRGRARKELKAKRTRMKAPALKDLALRLTHNVWFLLVKRVRGTAHKFATFDPPDKERFDVLAERWLIKGK